MMKKSIALLLAPLCCAALFCGCNQETVQPTDLAIVALNGQNMPAIHGDEEALLPVIQETVAAEVGSTAAVIIADGQPYLAGLLTFDEKDSKNDTFWAKEQEARAESVAAQIGASMASSPETDPIGAIKLAGRQLQAGTADRKRLVVAHSGISTAGALAMQNLDLTAVEQILPQLEEQNYLADLNGVEVEWYFLGDTSGEQAPLSPAQTESLRSFWQEYLKQSGAASVTFHSDLPLYEANSMAPMVSTVAVKAEPITGPVALASESLGFEPDSVVISNPEAAAAQLSGLADTLSANPSAHYIIAGSTAAVEGSTLESSKQFGLERAQAVKELLCSLGADSNQLTAVGIGIADTSVRGAEDAANRVVLVVPTADPLAEELLAVGLTD